MTVHRFADSLAYSHSEADAPYWLEVYQQAFPDMVDMIDLRSHGWHQKAGRDEYHHTNSDLQNDQSVTHPHALPLTGAADVFVL